MQEENSDEAFQNDNFIGVLEEYLLQLDNSLVPMKLSCYLNSFSINTTP